MVSLGNPTMSSKPCIISRRRRQQQKRLIVVVLLVLCNILAWNTAQAFTLLPHNGRLNHGRYRNSHHIIILSQKLSFEIDNSCIGVNDLHANDNETTSSELSSESDRSASAVHTLILCRHGDSIWNGGEPGTKETFTGWTDVPLSNKGIREAQETGRQLANFFNNQHDSQQKNVCVCFTSVLQRAQLTAHYCLWELSSAPDVDPLWQPSTQRQRKKMRQDIRYVMDYRLNERHYGALQGFAKEDVERGLHEELYCIGKDDPGLVQRWRRSWHTVPPLLDEDDPRRLNELAKFKHYCDGGGKDYLSEIPRGESLQQVAQNRIRPFLKEAVSPILNAEAARKTTAKDKWNSTYGNDDGGTALIVAHANSLRALIGVICNIDDSEGGDTNGNEQNDNKKEALKNLEALRLSTGVPLVLKYRQRNDEYGNESYEVCDMHGHLYHSSDADDVFEVTKGLPVYPLNCIPSSLRTTMESESDKRPFYR